MKKLYELLFQFLPFSQKEDSVVLNTRNFFDYSSSERIKLMRAAGREAQKEQRNLVKVYESRFGNI